MKNAIWLALLVLQCAPGPDGGDKRRRLSSLSASAAWVQLGNGEYDHDPGNSAEHHQTGRAQMTAWAFDKHQGREVLWVGSSHGGLWKSLVNSTGTVTGFQVLTDNLSTTGSHTLASFLVHTVDSDKILISTGTSWGDGDGVHGTSNGGATWGANTLTPAPIRTWKVIADRSDATGNTVLAAASTGLWRSHDFGATWPEQVESGNGEVTDLLQDPSHASKWYAGMKGTGVMYSVDGGSTWCVLASGITGTISRISLGASKADDRYLYAHVIDDGSALNGLYRFSALDTLPACGGSISAQWHDISNNATNAALDALDQGAHTAGIGVDPNDADHVLFGLQTPAETHNATAAAASVTWDIAMDGGHHDYNHFLFMPDGHTIVICNDGGHYLYDSVAKTIDDSQALLGISAFEPSSRGKIGQGTLASSWSNPDVFMAGLQDNGVTRGVIGSSPVMRAISGGDGGHVSIAPISADILAFSTTILESGTAGHRFISTDGANTVTSIECSLGGSTRSTMLIDPTPGLAAPLIFTDTQDSSGNNSLVKAKAVTTTCDWADVSSSSISGIITRIDHTTNPAQHEILATVQGDAHVWRYTGPRSATLALTLSRLPYPVGFSVPSKPDMRANADRSMLQPRTVYLTTGTGRPSSAWVSFDAGDTWTDVTGDIDTSLSLNKLVAQPKDPTQLYLATSKGLYRSGDFGAHWQAYSDGLRVNEDIEDLVMNSDAIDPPTLYVATNGRGFYQREVNQIPTITCPPPQTVECSSPNGTPATVTAHVGDAEGDELTVTFTAGPTTETDTVPSGAPPTSVDVTFTKKYLKGTHTVTATVSDGQGEAACTTTVTVVDTTPPVMTCTVGTPSLWPPDHDLVNVGLTAKAVDKCDGPLTPDLRVFSDEDDLGPTGPHFSPDAKDVGSGMLRLRSEREGAADGRVYFVTVTAEDSSGNSAAACCSATVPHDQSAASLASVLAQAANAAASCPARPAGYFAVGDGPVVGPKQ